MNKEQQTYCVGSPHYSANSIPQIIQKRSPRAKKHLKIIKSKCSVCVKNKSQTLTLYMTPGTNFFKSFKMCLL